MDLEQLTKHQIILLTLLVSFVTSIATGIITVSLMNQAPPSVTRSINQIVEHTIQTVVPSSQGPITSTVKTVVVKDDDLAAQSITTLQKSIIRITARGSNDLVARGVIISNRGTAITDAEALTDSGSTSFDAILSDGERVPMTLQATATSSSLAVVSVAVGTSTGFAAATIADPLKLQLGQSVLHIGGSGVDVVGEGVIAMLPSSGSPTTIESNVESSTPGSVLATLFGEVIGITTASSLDSGKGFYTLAALPSATSETKSTSTP